MTEEPGPRSRPATTEEVVQTLSFALRYQGRKRVHHADEMMARITAERLAEHLARSGLVVMKRPDAKAPSTSHHGHPAAARDADER
jgi:hypothetical protein